MFLATSGSAGSIAFNLSRDEYADQPAAERQHFTIYVEQSPGYCNLYNAMTGGSYRSMLGHVTSNRWELQFPPKLIAPHTTAAQPATAPPTTGTHRHVHLPSAG